MYGKLQKYLQILMYQSISIQVEVSQGALAFNIKQTIIRMQESLPSKKYQQVRSMSLGTCQQKGRKKAYVTKQEESRERVVGGKGVISSWVSQPTRIRTFGTMIWILQMTWNLCTEVIQSSPPHITLSPSIQTISLQKLLLTIFPFKFLLKLSTQNTAEAASKSLYWETSHLEILHCKEAQRET